MKRTIIRSALLVLCLILGCGSLTGALAADTAAAQTTVSLDNVYELAYKNNVSAKIAQLNLQQLYDGIEDMQDALDAAWSLSHSGSPEYAQYGSNLLKTLMPNQISSETKRSTELSVESAKKQIGYGGQSMLIACYSLEAQYGKLGTTAETLARGLASTRKMQQLGMATADTVKSLEQSQKTLASSMTAVQNSIAALKTKLSLYIGVDEAQLVIAPFAGFTSQKASDTLAAINYDADLKTAREACYRLKIQALTVQDSSGTQKDIENLTLENLKKLFPAAFSDMYLAVKTKAAGIETAEAAYAISQRNAVLAELRLRLGMVSRTEYLNVLSQQTSDRYALESAQLDFVSALYTYQAMVGGIWQQ